MDAVTTATNNTARTRRWWRIGSDTCRVKNQITVADEDDGQGGNFNPVDDWHRAISGADAHRQTKNSFGTKRFPGQLQVARNVLSQRLSGGVLAGPALTGGTAIVARRTMRMAFRLARLAAQDVVVQGDSLMAARLVGAMNRL